MGATDKTRTILATRWHSVKSGPFFEVADPPAEFVQALPKEYLTAVGEFGGREGFLGQTFLRLYRLEELFALNIAYQVPTLLPEVIVFASNGGGEAFAFASFLKQPSVVQVPFVPLCSEYAEHQASSFAEFVRSLCVSGESPECNDEVLGMEIHEVQPICFGGDPTDEANKAFVPPSEHAELCRFWNKKYRQMLDQ
jgi:hypothetical protein